LTGSALLVIILIFHDLIEKNKALYLDLQEYTKRTIYALVQNKIIFFPFWENFISFHKFILFIACPKSINSLVKSVDPY
jgi:hypothetical protein